MLSKEHKELVSVIIPVHDRFAVALEAIESVISQSYRPIEVVVIDDASGAPFSLTEEEIPGIAFRIVRSETNRGPGGAREIGRRVASGEYICYLDSDDYWCPEKTDQQVRLLSTNPRCGMCYCRTGEFQRLPIRGDEPLRQRNEVAYTSFIPTIFHGRPWSTSACMWTRRATNLIGPWFEAWTWEDYEYDCRAGCNDIEICCVPEVLCFKRSNAEIPQLSSTDSAVAITQRSSSVKEMSKSLKSFGKLSEVQVVEAYVRRVLRPLLDEVISIKQVDLARAICKDIRAFSAPLSKDWLISEVVETVMGLDDSMQYGAFYKGARYLWKVSVLGLPRHLVGVLLRKTDLWKNRGDSARNVL